MQEVTNTQINIHTETATVAADGWQEMKIDVRGWSEEVVDAGVAHVRMEVQIEALRAQMYDLLGVTDLSWRSRAHLPDRVRRRPIFRADAAYLVSSDPSAMISDTDITALG